MNIINRIFSGIGFGIGMGLSIKMVNIIIPNSEPKYIIHEHKIDNTLFNNENEKDFFINSTK